MRALPLSEDREQSPPGWWKRRLSGLDQRIKSASLEGVPLCPAGYSQHGSLLL